MSIQEQIWQYFLNLGFSPEGIAGIMGNIEKECKFVPNNVEDRAPYTDDQYTSLVDNGQYNNFINDGYGYGIVQWTYNVFKQQLLNYCQQQGKSIGDLNCQLNLLYLHLNTEGLLNTIKNATSIEEATVYFMIKFEKPQNQSISAQQERINYANKWYNKFHNKGGSSKMKYNTSNPPLTCMQTKSTCYKNTSKMAVKGILWHSTGANNKTIKRYVQPSETDPNYIQLLTKIGTNSNKNDWNHIDMQAGLNAWIGTLADGTVAAVQTMPWDYKPWGCGSGSKGSCNDGWIQFEICEDSLSDGGYFSKVYTEACELTAYLCKLYNINPTGSVNFNGTAVPTILCHQDSYQLGLGNNHSDIYHWFTKYGKTMNNVRNDVAKLLQGTTFSSSTSSNSNIELDQPTFKLQKGDEGEEVRMIQLALIQLGYNLGNDGADGDFGPITENAVKTFQYKNGLSPTGIFGTETFLAMKNALSDVPKVDEIYRVRKSWTDIKSQIGAYKNLNSAKQVVDSLGSAYHVYNSNGQEIYPIVSTVTNGNQTSIATIATNITTTKHYDTVVLASSSKDENGRYTGGKKGDQTGKEVYILNWYNSNWNYVLRPKDATLAENIARSAEAGCANNNIGYSQGARNTLYIEAQKVGLDLSKITTPCDCDCSSFVSICCICAGLSPSIFYAGGNMRTTYNMKAACEVTGKFTILSNSQYTQNSAYLKRGDILLNSNSHVVIVLQDGPKADPNAQVSINNINNTDYKVKIIAAILNVRAQANSSSKVVAQVTKNQIYTIVAEEGGFGKLKSGVGWIDLSYTEKI